LGLLGLRPARAGGRPARCSSWGRPARCSGRVLAGSLLGAGAGRVAAGAGGWCL